MFVVVIEGEGYVLEDNDLTKAEEWVQDIINCQEEIPLKALSFLLTDKVFKGRSIVELYQNFPEVDRANLTKALQQTKISCPPINTEIVKRTLNYLHNISYLDSATP